MICRDQPDDLSCFDRTYGKTSETCTQKKNAFRNDSPEGATDTSAMISGKLSILCVE